MTRVLAAVDVQHFAGDERGRFEIKDRVDDFLDFAHAIHGVKAGEEVSILGGMHLRVELLS